MMSAVILNEYAATAVYEQDRRSVSRRGGSVKEQQNIMQTKYRLHNFFEMKIIIALFSYILYYKYVIDLEIIR